MSTKAASKSNLTHGQEVAEKRKNLSLTQEMMADLLGVSKQAVSLAEKGLDKMSSLRDRMDSKLDELKSSEYREIPTGGLLHPDGGVESSLVAALGNPGARLPRAEYRDRTVMRLPVGGSDGQVFSLIAGTPFHGVRKGDYLIFDSGFVDPSEDDIAIAVRSESDGGVEFMDYRWGLVTNTRHGRYLVDHKGDMHRLSEDSWKVIAAATARLRIGGVAQD